MKFTIYALLSVSTMIPVASVAACEFHGAGGFRFSPFAQMDMMAQRAEPAGPMSTPVDAAAAAAVDEAPVRRAPVWSRDVTTESAPVRGALFQDEGVRGQGSRYDAGDGSDDY
ncbi:hypothetical protein KCG44_12455 [Pacificimonas sp. WHA3]|uniref:Lipoprotein n=1 Tax=Pacificimonas pallii TaxID=2827236 RepID=A0ABS6SH70_9SPHN|nr:hypothetical protein [Pacificimonas pallii]MBV7257595.1 hypothetical protein [Pacificimonas pallii]